MEHTAGTGYRYTLSMRTRGETIESPEKFNSIDDAIEYGRTSGLTRGDKAIITDHADEPYSIEFTLTLIEGGFAVRIIPPC